MVRLGLSNLGPIFYAKPVTITDGGMGAILTAISNPEGVIFCIGDFMQIDIVGIEERFVLRFFMLSTLIVAHGKLTGRNSNHSLRGSWRL